MAVSGLSPSTGWKAQTLTDEGRYVVTEKRRLTHTGHTPVAPSSSTTELDSLRNVPTAIKEAVRKMLKSGMHCVESERRFLQEEHEVTITRDVFHNLVKKTKAELGIVATQPVPSSSSSVPSALSSVPIDDMLLPQHKKKQRGRVGQKRVVGAAEQAAKRGKISASQAM